MNTTRRSFGLMTIAVLIGALSTIGTGTVATAEPAPLAGAACDPNYWPCIPAFPPDLNCAHIGHRVWVIGTRDPHRVDADRDGIGCEGWPIGPGGPPPPGPQPLGAPQPFTAPPPPPPPLCTNAATAAAAKPVGTGAGSFTAITPVRVIDTRSGSALAAGESRTFDIALGAVPTDATMIALNVTADAPTETGYLTVFAGGSTPPFASNVNFYAGTTTPNFVMARASSGKVTVYNSAGCTHVLIDVVGYVRPGSDNGFTPLTPERIYDSRPAAIGPIARNSTRTLTIRGLGGVPASADAVVINVTADAPTATDYLTLYPTGAARPTVSNVNFTSDRTVANLAVVRLSASGQLDLYNSAGATNVIIDVFGYFGTGGDRYVPTAPARILDARGPMAFGPGGTRELQITRVGGVPLDVNAVAINVTAVEPTQHAYLTVYPSGGGLPSVSNTNYRSGRTIANLVVVQLAPTGRIAIHNAAGTTGVLVDVAGYFHP